MSRIRPLGESSRFVPVIPPSLMGVRGVVYSAAVFQGHPLRDRPDEVGPDRAS